MKLEALDHPKTLDLAARLGVELPTVIGHLELLWAFTGKKSPQGDVGKWPDGAIARACYWMGDPAHFVNCLLVSGLVNAHKTHRLIVHDWHEHAPGWVRAKLKKVGLEFVKPTLEPSSEPSLEPSSDRSLEPSIQGKGSTREEKRGDARASRLPDDFSLTPERRIVAEAERLPADRTFAKFCDYWRAIPGAKGRKLDWDATWRNWCRNDKDRNSPAKANGGFVC